MTIIVKKFGKNSFGQCWAYGTFYCSEKFAYTGLFLLDKEYALIEDTQYEVKFIDVITTKKNTLKITIAL